MCRGRFGHFGANVRHPPPPWCLLATSTGNEWPGKGITANEGENIGPVKEKGKRMKGIGQIKGNLAAAERPKVNIEGDSGNRRSPTTELFVGKFERAAPIWDYFIGPPLMLKSHFQFQFATLI